MPKKTPDYMKKVKLRLKNFTVSMCLLLVLFFLKRIYLQSIFSKGKKYKIFNELKIFIGTNFNNNEVLI